MKGWPIGAVQNAMQRDGLDPKIMDLDPQKPVSSQMKRDADDPPLKDDPKYNKYFKNKFKSDPMARKEAMEKFYADDDKEDFDNFSKVV